MTATYLEILDAVEKYYGQGSDQWLRIAGNTATPSEIGEILKQVPGVSVTYSKSGNILGYDYSNPFISNNPVSAIDSNLQNGFFSSGSFNAPVPSTSTVNPETGIITMQSGAKAVSTGAKIATIADKASLAIIGTSLGIKLGKFIDSALYNANPEFWDEHLPTLNPETWDDIATTEGGRDFIRTIFKLENDTMTPYVDERVLAQTYQMLLQQGAYTQPGEYEYHGSTDDFPYPNITTTGTINSFRSSPTSYIDRQNAIIIGRFKGSYFYYTAYSLSNVDTGMRVNGRLNWLCTQKYTTFNGTTFYFTGLISDRASEIFSVDGIETTFPTLFASNEVRQIGTIIFDGEQPSGIEGITVDETATQIIPTSVINPTTGVAVTPSDNVDDVVSALKTAYPDLFTGEISETVPQEDGTTKTIYYIPTPLPDTSDATKPITGLNRQGTPELSPETNPQTQLDNTADSLTEPSEPPTTGSGDTPSLILPDGTSNALFAIYNPSQSELNSFGAWLWTNDFVTQLLKLFNDPMQAIIGLHKVYSPVPVGGTSTIHVGYLDSGVSSNTVSGQYTTVDCGSVYLPEFFGNVFDYEPFTRVNIFLPFIGFQQLDIGEIMRATISVKYHVDVITGACLAEVSVTRDNAGGIMYSFSGNCAVTYPVSSGSYMGIVSSVASTAISALGTIASGGSFLPFAMGAVNNLMHAHTNVSHSGSFSGNSGAMGVKTPYLIITRPQTKVADNSNVFIGFPSNEYHSLNERSGFVKVKECHIENIPATTDELDEIDTLLKTGVIL